MQPQQSCTGGRIQSGTWATTSISTYMTGWCQGGWGCSGGWLQADQDTRRMKEVEGGASLDSCVAQGKGKIMGSSSSLTHARRSPSPAAGLVSAAVANALADMGAGDQRELTSPKYNDETKNKCVYGMAPGVCWHVCMTNGGLLCDCQRTVAQLLHWGSRTVGCCGTQLEGAA